MGLDEVHELLMNWGRWCQSGEPLCLAKGEEAPCAISPIFEAWIPSHDWDLNWGEPGAWVDCPSPPVDERSAEATDKAVNGLQARHRRWLIYRYVREHYVDLMMLQAAQRALLYRLEGE